MTLSPSSLRSDLKCGKGSISKGEKCRKGPATVVEKLAPIALGLGLAAGAIALKHRGRAQQSQASARKAPSVPKDPPKPPPATPAQRSKTEERSSAAKKKVEAVLENNKKVASETLQLNIPDSASSKITTRTNPNRITSASESFYSWANTPGQSATLSIEEAEALIRKKGRILDINGIPDLDAAKGAADAAIGRDSLARQKVRAAYLKFYKTDSINDVTAPSRTDNDIQYYAPTQLQPPIRRDACWEGYVQAGMKRKGKREVPNCVPASSGVANPRAQKDTEDGKKYTKVVTNPETGRKNKVRYGAKGYRIAPGTDKGDNYCARSFGDMKSHGKDCSGPDRNTPLCLSRAKWKCSGKSSRRDGLTPGKS